MATVALSKDVFSKLKNAFGLAERKVTKMSIHLAVGDAVRIETVEFMLDKATDELVEVLKQYELREVEDEQ